MDKNWIPLMEYAVKYGVSLSTLRRHIKSNKIRYRVESGRYFLFDTRFESAELSDSYNSESNEWSTSKERTNSDQWVDYSQLNDNEAKKLREIVQEFKKSVIQKDELSEFSNQKPSWQKDIEQQLKNFEMELRKTQEELAELKMLVSLYEEKMSDNISFNSLNT